MGSIINLEEYKNIKKSGAENKELENSPILDKTKPILSPEAKAIQDKTRSLIEETGVLLKDIKSAEGMFLWLLATHTRIINISSKIVDERNQLRATEGKTAEEKNQLKKTA